ncbi:dTDP-4-dehydrorhamnose reductase [Castellaniella defragrans]|uniref:dTDP-4-dehydrorhamnose reductase n=1 Tax=Castellaniella defragrans TaxID=75697 RepID=A0A7W9TNN4_CASDE|nr:dTDP-4-dehydrorhamnose reductase [Castellaniella defragrans]KAB0616673.1 dTDP-4-dehydrorhamnose reductase [Castellaniella defragrans]MBB6084083.1 dTDP-4-dehydrorhamnose reductase [Castellaniella defragrans]
MRLLVTGRDGQLGFELRRALAPLGEVAAIDRADCDLSDAAAIRAAVRRHRPDVIVNAAAYTAVDRAEQDAALAQAINGAAPGVFGEEAARLGAQVVHFSTDYVFDGAGPDPYRETDRPAPQNVYGATKLAGEAALAASGARHLIFRTSWVVGAHGGNFAKTMLRLAAERDSLSIVADQIGAPTSAALLADVTAHAIRAGRDLADGVYHLTAGGSTSWHAYARHVIERARAAGRPVRVAPDAILPIATADYPTPARRPANSRLDTQKIRAALGIHLPDWRDGVDYVLDQLLDE